MLDLTIDGADEIDGYLRLIKGGGGALLIEKIVAMASGRMVVIADDTKRVAKLGAFPLPVEVVGFGAGAARKMIRCLGDAGCEGEIRERRQYGGQPFSHRQRELYPGLAPSERSASRKRWARRWK